MPKITPNAVVRFIDRAFPEFRARGLGTLDRGAHQSLATLIALVDAIGDDVLAALTDEQHQDLLVAIEYLRVTTNRWNYPPNPGGPNIVVTPFVPLANRHPVAVVLEVMEACPEEPAVAAQTRLAFLADPDLERSVAIDVASAEGAVADGRYKNACVMAGSAIEALLLWAVQRRTTADHTTAVAAAQATRVALGRPRLQQPDADPRRWVLEQYLEVARHLPVLSPTPADAAMLAKDFRNLIHPGRAERLQTQATRGSAGQAIAAMMLIIEDLSIRQARGEL